MVRVREFAGVASAMFLAMAVAMGLQSAHINVAAYFAPSSPLPPPVRLASNDPIVALPLHAPLTAHLNNSKAQGIAQVVPVATPPDQAEEVALRVRDSVPAHLYPYFDMYLYVSKSASGPWAQHMYIFHKGFDGQLVFEKAILVSTGRELREKYFTSTPTGLFELDPNRFDRVHFSKVWHHAPMPWAMFLNLTVHGHQAGIAIHSGIGHVAELGRRASGGCVRLPPDEAQLLFEQVQSTEGGMVPVFGFDATAQSTLRDGEIVRDTAGNPELVWGYKVLLIIQDYPGGPAMLASLT